jgi:hypothetical protein
MNGILCVLNLKASKKIKLSPDEIPNLINAKTLKDWQAGDTDPYYKIQKIDFPIISNGLNYVESFFESFISKLKDRPTPGSKSGHEMMYGKRPNTDLIMIGGKIESNGKGKGSVYFKNYIPHIGESGNNDVFIRENKSDMVHYSLVSYVKQEREETPDGDIINVVESMYGERNDAVEWGTGAMKQVTNKDEKKEGNKSIKGESNLDKDELLKKLNALKANGELTLSDVAEAMGLQKQILTEDHEKALKTVNALNKMGVENPVSFIKDLQERIKVDSESVRNAELDTIYGNDPESKNFLRQYAGQQTKDLSGEKLKNKIEELKKDPIALKLAGNKADYTSDENFIGKAESKKKPDTEEKETNGTRVDKM